MSPPPPTFLYMRWEDLRPGPAREALERFFDPGEEFVYYEEGPLRETLGRVLADFGAYQRVIDRAFERAREQYTTEAFVDRYLSAVA